MTIESLVRFYLVNLFFVDIKNKLGKHIWYGN
jgi:hypothetical protein